MKLIKKITEIYKSEHPHFLFVDYDFYKKWKGLIKIAVILNGRYVPCEIFRKKYKIHTNFVVIGLKNHGKPTKRRVNGYAKEYLSENPGICCVYCEIPLTMENATADHIIPISQYGNNCQVNLLVSCESCNGERGNIPFTEYLKIKNIKYKKQKHIFI